MGKKKDWSHLPTIHNTKMVDGVAVIDGVRYLKCKRDGCDNLSHSYTKVRHTKATVCNRCRALQAIEARAMSRYRLMQCHATIRVCQIPECGKTIIIPPGRKSGEYTRKYCGDECTSIALKRSQKRVADARKKRISSGVTIGKAVQHGAFTQKLHRAGGSRTPINIIVTMEIIQLVRFNKLNTELLNILKSGLMPLHPRYGNDTASSEVDNKQTTQKGGSEMAKNTTSVGMLAIKMMGRDDITNIPTIDETCRQVMVAAEAHLSGTSTLTDHEFRTYIAACKIPISTYIASVVAQRHMTTGQTPRRISYNVVKP